jgi:hypothetical protein
VDSGENTDTKVPVIDDLPQSIGLEGLIIADNSRAEDSCNSQTLSGMNFQINM